MHYSKYIPKWLERDWAEGVLWLEDKFFLALADVRYRYNYAKFRIKQAWNAHDIIYDLEVQLSTQRILKLGLENDKAILEGKIDKLTDDLIEARVKVTSQEHVIADLRQQDKLTTAALADCRLLSLKMAEAFKL